MIRTQMSNEELGYALQNYARRPHFERNPLVGASGSYKGNRNPGDMAMARAMSRQNPRAISRQNPLSAGAKRWNSFLMDYWKKHPGMKFGQAMKAAKGPYHKQYGNPSRNPSNPSLEIAGPVAMFSLISLAVLTLIGKASGAAGFNFGTNLDIKFGDNSAQASGFKRQILGGKQSFS